MEIHIRKNCSLQNYMLKESRSYIIICAPRNTVINGLNVWRPNSPTSINLNTRHFYMFINKLPLLSKCTFYFLHALSIGKFLTFKNAFRGESKKFEN